MTARAQAIRLLADLFNRVDTRGDQVRWDDDITVLVDTLIEAARAPESDHTRAVDGLRSGGQQG